MYLELLKQDLLRWCDAEKRAYSLISAIRLWMKYDEFKCLVNYRLKSTKMSKFSKIFSRAEKRHNLYICGLCWRWIYAFPCLLNNHPCKKFRT